MKKLLILSAVIACALTACNGKGDSDALAADSTPDVSTVEGQRDSLMTLIGDISDNILEVNRMENILVAGSYETPDKKQELMDNIAALRQTLAERRKALEELEAKLKKSNGYTAKLKKTIESQKQLIEEQSRKIEQLEVQLGEARQQIAGLNESVDSLSSQVSDVTAQRVAETQRADAATEEANKANVCYYVAGSSKELKEHKILEKKFLGKTKIMEGDYDRGYFTKADRRTISEINTYSAKAKLLTKHPAASYEIADEGGVMVVKIKDKKTFWEKSNFLVIQTD